jgi:hypothetical protein
MRAYKTRAARLAKRIIVRIVIFPLVLAVFLLMEYGLLALRVFLLGVLLLGVIVYLLIMIGYLDLPGPTPFLIWKHATFVNWAIIFWLLLPLGIMGVAYAGLWIWPRPIPQLAALLVGRLAAIYFYVPYAVCLLVMLEFMFYHFVSFYHMLNSELFSSLGPAFYFSEVIEGIIVILAWLFLVGGAIYVGLMPIYIIRQGAILTDRLLATIIHRKQGSVYPTGH